MKRCLLLSVLFAAATQPALAGGLLIPSETDLPPLALLNHRVRVTLEDQVAITRVEQTFRNHTDRKLEATFVFPVPPGASVREFTMWSNGTRMKGELLRATEARSMYTSIVRQTKNPALLDYVGSDLLSMKIFPIEPNSDQKVAVSFTAVAKRDLNVVEYVYPLESDRAAASTLEEFQLHVTLKSQEPIGNIYSPSHQITVNQKNDHEAYVQYQQYGAQLNRDFQLFYTTSERDIGLTALEHRPISDEDGYVMLLVSPRAELSEKQKVPRDIVFVVDTSGSMMQDKKMDQAKAALRKCLDGLTTDDRFALVSFATTVNSYRDHLVPASEEHIKAGKGWVAGQYAGGGTAIHRALSVALGMRSSDENRMFTVVFFTDGQPTIGETDGERILADVKQANSANTRIFTFGLGNDLNAVLLDQLAEQTRALSTYVRPDQDVESSVTSFFRKIHHPVLANLKLSTRDDVQLVEVYPPELPDLFHGDQLVVLARYQGTGQAHVVLDGKVGPHDKQFVYDVDFRKQADSKPFVEDLWARRKVGYLLDQIRINGEKSELVDEVVRLAKAYGITTPYTSYLIMPDTPAQQLAAAGGGAGGRLNRIPAGLAQGQGKGEGKADKVEDFARRMQRQAGELAKNRGAYQDRWFEAEEAAATESPAAATKPAPALTAARDRLAEAKALKQTLDAANFNYRNGHLARNQVEKLGVDLAVCTNRLKCQSQMQATAIRNVARRNCMEIGGVWIDEAFTAKTPTLAVKAQSDAYFRILQQQPQMREVFRLGNHLVWIAPNGTALVVDAANGKEQLSDREIAVLFTK